MSYIFETEQLGVAFDSNGAIDVDMLNEQFKCIREMLGQRKDQRCLQ